MIEDLVARCRVALALGEPLFMEQAEFKTLLREYGPHHTDTTAWIANQGAARFMGIEIVIDPDRALLQANRYGMTEAQLDEAKARRDAEQRSRMDAILRRTGRPR